MDKYDDLFDDAAPTDSVFAEKGALDPLKEPDQIISRDDQEEELARILSGGHEGYLPTTVSVYLSYRLRSERSLKLLPAAYTMYAHEHVDSRL